MSDFRLENGTPDQLRELGMMHEVAYQDASGQIETAMAADGPERGRRIALRLMDQAVANLPNSRADVACKPGCAMCCHLTVDAAAGEILGIAEYLERSLSGQAMRAFLARLAASAEQVRAMSEDERKAANLACPLLVDGRCSAYTARPMMCRRHHSKDLSACEAIYADPIGNKVERSAVAIFEVVNMAVLRAYLDAHSVRNLDRQHWELVSGLDEALTDPGCRQRYLRGETPFLRTRANPTE